MQKIKDLEVSMKNLQVEFIVIKLLGTGFTKDSDRVYDYLVADDTGSIIATIFNILLDAGDIIYFNDAYVSFYKEKKKIFISGNGFIRRLGEIQREFVINEEHKNLYKY